MLTRAHAAWSSGNSALPAVWSRMDAASQFCDSFDVRCVNYVNLSTDNCNGQTDRHKVCLCVYLSVYLSAY